jgi:hypothetical protein
MMHEYSYEIKQKLVKSWMQVWDSRFSKMLEPINYFMKFWHKHLDKQSSSVSREQLNDVIFWYHSQLNLYRASSRWDAVVWNNLINGVYTTESVLRVEQLIKLIKEDSQISIHVKQAIRRLIAKFSVTWQNMINEVDSNEQVSMFLAMTSEKTNWAVELDSDNRIIYEQLLKDTYESKDLLSTFKELITKNSVSLNDIADHEI